MDSKTRPTWNGAGLALLSEAGGGIGGTALLDFGAFPGASDASVDVTGQGGIQATSRVKAWLSPVATVDHSADEHRVEPIAVFAGGIVPGAGFTIYGAYRGIGETLCYGRWTVAWEWV